MVCQTHKRAMWAQKLIQLLDIGVQGVATLAEATISLLEEIKKHLCAHNFISGNPKYR